MSACDKNQNPAESRAGKLITELRVRELKTELEKRGLDSQGVKVVLTVRLSKAIREEGHNPEDYVFNMSGDEQNVASVENSDGLKADESLNSSTDAHDTTHDSLGGNSLKIVEDSPETSIDEAPKIVEEEDKPVFQIPIIEEKKEEVVVAVKQETIEEEKQTETVPELPHVDMKNEPEELEGEDEFEEVEEEDEQNGAEDGKTPEESKEVEEASATRGAADDDIFLDDEDLLEDPLDEQPLATKEEEKKLHGSVASTIPTVISTNTSRDGTPTPATGSAAQKAFLFADDTKKTSIWIRGMTPATKASSVKQLASQFGKVLQSKIFNSKPINGEIKNCFAFVTFADAESMDAAIAALHRKDHQGRMLRVEKVAESHLTGSAERIAKEKLDSNEKKQQRQVQDAEQLEQEENKKRAVIQAPEEPKRKERQTIQAPEKKNNRAIIQAPERDHRDTNAEKERARRDRKPIVYKLSPGHPAVRTTDDDDDRGRSSERDTRRTISAAAPSRRTVSPPVHRSSRAARAGEPSLIISARVDTSGCRGGQPTKRSVERHVPNSITTSQLRRNPIHVPRSPPPRAAYQTQQYTTHARDVRDARAVRDTREARGDHRHDTREYRSSAAAAASGGNRRDVNTGGSAARHSSSSSSSAPRDSRHQHQRREDSRRRDDSRHRDGTTSREREMLEMLRRKEEEHRLREEKLEMQREREKMKFEAEKLERAKLELELSKQKLALQAALMSENKYQVSSGGDRGTSSSSRALTTSTTTGSSSRRRQADHFSPPSRSSKVHVDDRTSRGRSGTGRHTGSSSTTIPSARIVATNYGNGLTNSLSGSTATTRVPSTNIGFHGSSTATKEYDHRAATNYRTTASSSYDTTSTIGGYQSYSNTGYGTDGYQSQVWNGYDNTGLTVGSTWGAGTASASSSATSTTGGGGQWQYSTNSTTPASTARTHRDYTSYPGRSNY